MHVFLIDDDAFHRRALASLLESWRCTVIGHASDGASALVALAALGSLDLIITDCQMPVMDGIALTRQLRASRNAVPIIMLSGQDSQQISDAALSAGVSCFLSKPLDIDQLHRVLGRLVPTYRVA
jgi:CheY-like chemotaxis protein